MRLAAIDIGSNAMRLHISEVSQSAETDKIRLKKIQLYRLPVRLGEDAFLKGKISPATATRFLKAMTAFRCMMDIHNVVAYRACATSALRCSQNAPKLIAQIKNTCQINIEVIDGQEEASLVAGRQKHIIQKLALESPVLYVDVGGGSTEIALLGSPQQKTLTSFQIGTVRLLHQQVKTATWTALSDWLTQHIMPYHPTALIGSGGNINRIFKRIGTTVKTPLTTPQLIAFNDDLLSLSILSKMEKYNLTRDRADVITPALSIFLFILKHTNIEKIYVPKIGVSDGILKALYKEQLMLKF